MVSGLRFLIPIVLVLAVFIGGAFFIVSETEQVVITQLGKPVCISRSR